MNKATMPSKLRAALIALAAITTLALSVSTASAVNVHLRIEGQSKTHFSGDVNTNPRSVPGGVDNPTGCRANATPATFASANAITAAADALGADKITTTGTFFNWGTMLCGVDGEASTGGFAGWLVRINQQDTTAPNGYVTATDPLSNNDSVVLYFSPHNSTLNTSLELRLPAEAKTGEPVTGYVDAFSMSTDLKSPGAGVAVSGGGTAAQSDATGAFQIAFPTAGKYLISANKTNAVRGSQWVTVSDAAKPVPVAPPTQAQIDKQRRVAARARCRSANNDDRAERTRCIRNANRIGRTLTAQQRRVDAREACVRRHPTRGSSARVGCIRSANRIGR